MREEPNPARQSLSTYPMTFRHRILYSDMDGFRHLNNGATGRYFEEGRSELNMRVFGEGCMTDPPEGLQILFASLKIDFLAQAYYPGTVEIASAVSRVGNSSWNIVQAAFQNSKCFATADAVMVKARNGKSEKLSDEEKQILLKYHTVN